MFIRLIRVIRVPIIGVDKKLPNTYDEDTNHGERKTIEKLGENYVLFIKN